MKDKLIQIRADEDFIAKLLYLQKIYGLKSLSATIRFVIEKEYRKEVGNTMTYDECVDALVKKHLVCPKCGEKHWVIEEKEFARESKIFRCKSCNYEKELVFDELAEFNQQAHKILKSALAGDFPYNNQIEDLANTLLK